MKTCIALVDISSGAASACGNIVEGTTDFCAHHNRENRKSQERFTKNQEKKALLLERQREKQKQPRKTISKNPKDWGNTFLCSDGTRVRQEEINFMLKMSYKLKYPEKLYACEGCGLYFTAHHAHIIPQARCKKIGKTELIWDVDNFFRADHECNSAIENPKGNEWKRLLNIEHCLSFIKLHDPELYTKFELSAANQEHEPHKDMKLIKKELKPNEYQCSEKRR